jgi:AcrR family transcriptional regulator
MADADPAPASDPTPASDLTTVAIVAAALAIAAAEGWENVRLHGLALRTGIPLPVIGARFRDVDAIANAWFAAARLHLLAQPWQAIGAAAADRRLAVVMERWLDFFGPNRVTAAAIVRGKCHPSHAHHWVPLVFDLSRLVHDFLDVARVPGRGRLRQAQEVALTAITIAMLRDWAGDRSADLVSTRRRLRRRLAAAGRLAQLSCRPA